MCRSNKAKFSFEGSLMLFGSMPLCARIEQTIAFNVAEILEA